MEIRQKIKPPRMPDFIIIDDGPVPRDHPQKESPKISVGQLTQEQALEYAELMKNQFMMHWSKKSKENTHE